MYNILFQQMTQIKPFNKGFCDFHYYTRLNKTAYLGANILEIAYFDKTRH